MYDEQRIRELGRKNEWPCIAGSMWEEPYLCPSYGLDGCPCQSAEDRPCPCNESGLFMDILPFALFS